jgi:copper(I)-binding protein
MLPVSAQAHGYKTRTIEISHPWTFEQEGKGVDAMIGMTLKNKGKAADSLLRVETPDAASAELRDQGKVVPRIEIPPGTELTLHANGPHIVLRAVRKTLFAYNNIYITLVFAKAGKIKVEVVVEDKPS